MGILTFLPLLVTTVLLLDLSHSGGVGFTKGDEVKITRTQVNANFDFKIKLSSPGNRFSDKRDHKVPAGVRRRPHGDVLSLSTVLLCDPLKEIEKCEPCIRVDITLNSTAFPKLRAFVVYALEESHNQFHAFRFINKGTTEPGESWKVTYDCLQVPTGQNINFSLFTVPYYSLRISKTYFIQDRDAKPAFQFEHFPEKRKIEVSIHHGPKVKAHLCYRGSLVCEPLSDEATQAFNVSQKAILQYEYLAPCLCIEVYYLYRDARRNQICPFDANPDAYNSGFWQITDRSSHAKNQMWMELTSPCPVVATSASLCEKRKGTCLTIPEATVQEDESHYTIDDVDKNPNLCFKFTIMNRSYIKCPEIKDPDWNVTVKTQFFQVLLSIFSLVPGSFSATTCKVNQSTGHCDPQSPVFNITRLNDTSPQGMDVALPLPRIGSCVQVWRSDVRFAYKHLFCPDFSHRHLGLVLLSSFLVVFTLVILLALCYQMILKIFTAPLWRHTVLLVYSPDSDEYKVLISAFADFLQSILGCEVILDLWDTNTVSQIGMLPWFYQKRELVTQRKGKVIMVWTRRSSEMYKQWRTSDLSSFPWRDPHNLFSAAMAVLQRDLEVEGEKDTVEDYTMVYFEGLCEKQDIPTNMRKITRYHLFKDLYRLVNKLQGTTCLSPPCLIKTGAKYLMRKLINSEKSTSLQGHVELCRQQLREKWG
ncbi:interleukin-17 receptor E [Ascaphus truei]|uniref:interleukin-17 receptor E n=1 Tax=Ascaphus truei TaxID=8439 RepID=UPI003F59E2EB